MGYEIITIEPTVTAGTLVAGDVVFNLIEVKMPARACKVINIFMEVAAGGGEDSTKIGVLFFQKNTTPTLGTLNLTANIDSDDFENNKYIGQKFLMLDSTSSLDLDVIDTTALYYQCGSNTNVLTPDDSGGAEGMVLKGDAGASVVYAAGVIHNGSPTLDGTDNIKIHLHVEY